MSKYIDAEKLIAEIERRINIKENLTQHPEMSDMKESLYDIIGAFQSIKSFIISLQQEQPEVDLEKEITKWIDSGDITDTRFNDYDDSDIERTARHFYELGLNARKEE